MSIFILSALPSALPGISPTGGENGWWEGRQPIQPKNAEQTTIIRSEKRAPSVLPPCGGDARQGRGGYRVNQSTRILPGKKIAWR